MKNTLLSVLMAGTLMAGSASAATVLTFYDDAATQSNERFTLSCSLGCVAYNGTSFMGTDGDLEDLANASEALEIEYVNSISGENFGASDFNKDDSPSTTFMSDALYILFKIGKSPNTGVIQSLSAGNTFTFTETGQGAGLSHYSELGEIAPVPLPAGAALMLTGLGALAVARRRRS